MGEVGGKVLIKVVIADEFNVYSEGLKLIINDEGDMKVVGIVNNEQNDFSRIAEAYPDVILFHVKLFDLEIEEIIHKYKRDNPQVKIIYIAKKFDKSLFYETVKNKPNGIILNDFPPEKFVNIIRDVYDENYILSGEIARELINGMEHLDELKKLVLKKKLQEKNIEATMRDLDILYFIYLGKSNKEITKQLRLPDKSVRYYVSKAYKKIARHNRTDAIAFLKGLIE